MDLDERFAGWKFPSLPIERGKFWELLDGVVMY